MLLRDDGLAAWKWNPDHTPHVTDINNATDGDILIAYALARAAEHWHRKDFREAATAIVESLAKHVVIRHGGHRLLLPAVAGFTAKDRSDGPVVNLSYWIFEAFPVFAKLDPDDGWNNIGRDGQILLANAQFSPRELPPDWLSLRGAPEPAKGFPPEFGYNAIRIPLYLIRGKTDDKAMLRRLLNGMSDKQGDPVIVDLDTGAIKDRLTDPGYRAITALARCVLDGTPLPADVRSFSPTDYYPSTLHLLALATIAEQNLKCGGQ
ncbi:hypothetical protein COL154_014041 [Colletotrichum chrysophilum]|nr:hypothetical protein COL154_014041 [Colletotrichum chrysophilum]